MYCPSSMLFARKAAFDCYLEDVYIKENSFVDISI